MCTKPTQILQWSPAALALLALLSGCAGGPTYAELEVQKKEMLPKARKEIYAQADELRKQGKGKELYELGKMIRTPYQPKYNKYDLIARELNEDSEVLIQQAAEIGYPQAMLKVAENLGEKLHEKNPNRDAYSFPESCAWASKASNASLPNIPTAWCYTYGGLGSGPNYNKAVEELERVLANHSYDPGITNWVLGQLYLTGGPGLPMDKAKALQHIKIAADFGHEYAQRKLVEIDDDAYPPEYRQFYEDATRVVRDMNFRQTVDKASGGNFDADFTGTYKDHNLTLKLHFFKTGQGISGIGLSMICITDNQRIKEGMLEQIHQKMKSTLGSDRMRGIFVQFPQF